MALFAVAACTSGRATPAPVTTDPVIPVTPAPITTSTTTPLDQVPAVIDVAYVQRVLDALAHVDGEASRIIFAAKVPTPEFEAHIQAVFEGPALESARRVYGEVAAAGFDTFATPPADPAFTVTAVVSKSGNCVVVDSTTDFSGRYRVSVTPKSGVTQLARVDRPGPLNPTVWRIVVDASKKDGVDYSKGCG